MANDDANNGNELDPTPRPPLHDQQPKPSLHDPQGQHLQPQHLHHQHDLPVRKPNYSIPLTQSQLNRLKQLLGQMAGLLSSVLASPSPSGIAQLNALLRELRALALEIDFARPEQAELLALLENFITLVEAVPFSRLARRSSAASC